MRPSVAFLTKLSLTSQYALLIITCWLLVSCQVKLSKQEQLKNLRALPSMEQEAQQKLNNQLVFAAGNWPDKEWWHRYHSAELDQLISESLCHNPSIQEVRNRIEAARQESVVAGSVLYPLLYFKSAYTKLYNSKHGLYRAFNPRFPLSTYLVDLSLSFNYEFDFWGRNRNLFYAAIGEAKAQEAEAAQVVLITTTAIAQAYFAYKTNLLRKHLYQELLQVRLHLLQLNNLLLNKGLSSALSPFLAIEKVNETKKQLAQIDNELAVDKHLLNILVGRGPETPIPISAHLPPLPKKLQIPQTLSLDLLARRPDLMAQIWRAKALAFRTGAAKADFYPNVNLMGFVGLESTSWRHLFERSSTAGMAKPAINLPLFTAGAIQANINALHAQFNAAIAAYNNLLLRSTQEVLDILAFAQSIYRQRQEQTIIIREAKNRLKLTKLRQLKGLDSQFETYYFQEALLERQLIDALILYNQYLASIKLVKALGGGYCQPRVPLAVPPEIIQNK